MVKGVSLRGATRRNSTGEYYFEARMPGHPSGHKLYCTKIKLREVGALCYDILQRYSESKVVGGKRKAAVKLNYPEYSRTLQLETLPSNFDIWIRKEEAMEIILRQAQAAAKNLPESLRLSTPAVGSPSPSNRSSSHRIVPKVIEKRRLKRQMADINEESGMIFAPVSCRDYFTSSMACLKQASKAVVSERLELRKLIDDINEESGMIFAPVSCREVFTSSMACLKQASKSVVSECLEMRKLIDDHNRKVMDKWLMEDDNDSSGRQRANEDERLPRLSIRRAK